MHNSNDTLALTRPATARTAYGRVIRGTEDPRSIEYRVFAEITAALQSADRPDATPVDRVAAIHDNRELWVSLACSVADDANALSDSLRAGIISLAIWVNRESTRLLACRDTLLDLTETNRTVMVGLAPQDPPQDREVV